MEELYVVLYPKALAVVLNKVHKSNYAECKTIAHDITVDFLFISKSFRETYDRSRSIKPFFNSYTDKKLRGYFENQMKRAFRYPSLTDEYLNLIIASSDGGLNSAVFASYAKAASQYLDKKYFVTRKFAVPLSNVMWATIESVARHGSIRVGWVSESLGCPTSVVWGCVAKMRRELERGEFYATQDLGDHKQRGFGKRLQKSIQGGDLS